MHLWFCELHRNIHHHFMRYAWGGRGALDVMSTSCSRFPLGYLNSTPSSFSTSLALALTPLPASSSVASPSSIIKGVIQPRSLPDLLPEKWYGYLLASWLAVNRPEQSSGGLCPHGVVTAPFLGGKQTFEFQRQAIEFAGVTQVNKWKIKKKLYWHSLNVVSEHYLTWVLWWLMTGTGMWKNL